MKSCIFTLKSSKLSNQLVEAASLLGLLLLNLADYFVEVVIASFVGGVVLEHFVLVVVAGLVVETADEANQKQGEVNPHPVVHSWRDAFV